jgi:transposase-like protein
MNIWIPQMLANRKFNDAAWRGKLNCPFCNHEGGKLSRWKFVEKVTPFIVRYRCKDCNRTIKYEFTNNTNFMMENYWAARGSLSLLEKLKRKTKKLKRS